MFCDDVWCHGISCGSTLGIFFSRILKVAMTKECPPGCTEAAKQPYKLNRTLSVAISLLWVVNPYVCHREVYVVCAQSATTSKLWEGAEKEGVGGCCPLLANHGQPQRIQPIMSGAGILFAHPGEVVHDLSLFRHSASGNRLFLVWKDQMIQSLILLSDLTLSGIFLHLL